MGDQGGAPRAAGEGERRTRGGQAQAPRRRHRAEDLARDATPRRWWIGAASRVGDCGLRSHDRRAHRGGVPGPASSLPPRSSRVPSARRDATLRALALLLASCGTGDGDANWCSLAAAFATTRAEGSIRPGGSRRSRWMPYRARRPGPRRRTRSRRAPRDSSRSSAPRRRGSFPDPDAEAPRGGREAAEAAAASLADPRELPAGARLHARVCDALGEPDRRDDSVAATRRDAPVRRCD